MSEIKLDSSSFRLPNVVARRDVQAAAKDLRIYYGARYRRDGEASRVFTGAWFDEFDPSGTRDQFPDEFTPDDLVAVSLLNTPIKMVSQQSLLVDLKEEISQLLAQLPLNVSLWEVQGPVDSAWEAWKLEDLLCDVPEINVTRASKLIARKRPMLYPIIDSVVRDTLETKNATLQPLYKGLQDEDLRKFLIQARNEAGLPEAISVLRVLDVLTWLQGTGLGSEA